MLLNIYFGLVLALALLMPGIGANNANHAFAADDFAIFAKLLH
jgi:hypothetical protein